MTNREIINIIAEACNGDAYYDYSGRGMFGNRCVGVVTSHNGIKSAIAAAHKLGWRNERRDSMGLDYIIYWPSKQEKE